MKRFLLVLLAFLLATASVHARSSSGGGGAGDEHLLSMGGGVSNTSLTSSLFENPAGLSNNDNSRFLLEGLSNNSFNSLGVGAGFFTGNGTIGGGIDVRARQNNSFTAYAGLAAEITSLNMALGVSMSETSGNGWGVNVGTTFNPHGKVRVGLVAVGLSNGLDTVAAGIAYDPSAEIILALDAGYSLNTKGMVAKPTVGIRLQPVQLAFGYGISVQGTGGSWVPDGFGFGVGIPLGKTFALQGYYNQLAQFYLGLTISL